MGIEYVIEPSCMPQEIPSPEPCSGCMAYPIPGAAEAWLLELLPEDLSTTAGQLLIQAVSDFGWDGEHARALRASEDGSFFESRRALAVRWGSEEDDLAVTSDQLFHMLFQVGRIGPGHAFMICLFFGIVPHDIDTEALNGSGRASALSAGRVPEPPAAECLPMAMFLRALLTAARLDANLLIDG